VRKLRKTFDFFDHRADVGIRGYGKTVEEAFGNGAKALFSLMIDLRRVKAEKTFEIHCQALDRETLFVEWLNELLAQSGIHRVVFSHFEVTSIQQRNNHYFIKASVKGDAFDSIEHKPRIEVKAATYTELKVEKGVNGVYLAQTIVDV
jgi:SHS2 domain-containing protein